MINKVIFYSTFVFFASSSFAQKSKLQTAWRSLSDYEETVKDGKPDLNYLTKANDAIDLALANEDTKKLAKTHAYKLRISYAQYQYHLNEEIKKLEASIKDKNERASIAYGNTSLSEFEIASEELNKVKELDPKFISTIQDGILNGMSSLSEDESKFAIATQQMKMEASNIASGKYKVKKYEEAAEYFYKTGFMNTVLSTAKDTANFNNACIAAGKSKNPDKILEYNKKMIEAKIASAYNYESIFNAYILKSDTNSAMDVLQKARQIYPDDIGLLTQETNMFYAQDKQQDALKNLKISIDKDPTNALFYLFTGNIYDNLANPKDKSTNKDLPKPANFDELFKNAETNYIKAIELNPANKEYMHNALYDLGAMYNNYGGYVENKKMDKITDMAKYQKENGAKSQEYYKKAIPYLEQALAIKSDDKSTMNALRLLYFKTGNDTKAKEMSEKIKLME